MITRYVQTHARIPMKRYMNFPGFSSPISLTHTQLRWSEKESLLKQEDDHQSRVAGRHPKTWGARPSWSSLLHNVLDNYFWQNQRQNQQSTQVGIQQKPKFLCLESDSQPDHPNKDSKHDEPHRHWCDDHDYLHKCLPGVSSKLANSKARAGVELFDKPCAFLAVFLHIKL